MGAGLPCAGRGVCVDSWLTDGWLTDGWVGGPARVSIGGAEGAADGGGDCETAVERDGGTSDNGGPTGASLSSRFRFTSLVGFLDRAPCFFDPRRRAAPFPLPSPRASLLKVGDGGEAVLAGARVGAAVGDNDDLRCRGDAPDALCGDESA